MAPLGRSDDLGEDLEQEIDRLVRERLEGGFTDRTQMRDALKASHNDGILNFRQRLELAARALVAMPMVLLGQAPGEVSKASQSACVLGCGRAKRKQPQVVYESDDEGEKPARPPRQCSSDDFVDLVVGGSPPVAPATPAAGLSAPAAEEEEDTLGAMPEVAQKPKKRRPPGTTGSLLSLSSVNMSSSAAALLGGGLNVQQRPLSARRAKAEAAPTADTAPALGGAAEGVELAPADAAPEGEVGAEKGGSKRRSGSRPKGSRGSVISVAPGGGNSAAGSLLGQMMVKQKR